MFGVLSFSAHLAIVAGCTPSSPCDAAVDYPAPLDGATAVVHVAGSCDAAGADGSAERPYATISEALAAAPEGASVVVAPGVYEENIEITRDVALLGSSSASSPTDAMIILQAPSDNAVVVKGGRSVVLRGMRVEGASGVGVGVTGDTSVTIEASAIRGTTGDAAGKFGFGLLASDGAAIILQRSEVSGSAGAGVLVSSARAIILQNELLDNAGAGVRLESATDEVRIEGNQVEGNGGAGVAVFSSRAIILQNTVRETISQSDKGIADGILVADLAGGAPGVSGATITGNTIAENGRIGVFLSGATAKAIILQNNQIDGNGFGAKFGAGVWLQQGAGSDPESMIADNTVQDNRFVGIGMRGATQGIILQNNTISGTVLHDYVDGASSFSIGDGLQLLAGASAQVAGNTLQANGRFGLVLDSADGAMTTITGNQILDSGQYGIILQNQPIVPDTGANTFSGNSLGDVDASPATPHDLNDQDLAVSL